MHSIILSGVAQLTPKQSYDNPTSSEVTLEDMIDHYINTTEHKKV